MALETDFDQFWLQLGGVQGGPSGVRRGTFWLLFGSWGPLGPKTPPRSPKTPPRGLLGAILDDFGIPKRPQDLLKSPQDPPKSSQDLSRRPPRPLQEASWDRFWSDLASSLIVFGANLDGLLDGRLVGWRAI